MKRPQKRPKLDKDLYPAIIIYIIALFFAMLSIWTLRGCIPVPIPEKIFCKESEVLKIMTFNGDLYILANDGHKVAISEEEYNLMCSVVMAEAEGEKYEVQEAVAQTILNRWLCEDKFPDTITEVIEAPGAYVTVESVPTLSVRLAVRNAIHFYNTQAMEHPKTMYYFRDSYYHNFGIRYRQIGNLYFSLAEDATD